MDDPLAPGAPPEVVVSRAGVALRRTREPDLDFVLRAENDPENVPFVGQWTREGHRAFARDPDNLHLVVERSGDATGRPTGYVLLAGLANPDRAMLVKRLVITEKRCGLGRGALECVKALAFGVYGSHRLWLDVREENPRARALYRAAGFVEEGMLRDASRYLDGYVSLVVMSILDREHAERERRREDA